MTSEKRNIRVWRLHRAQPLHTAQISSSTMSPLTCFLLTFGMVLVLCHMSSGQNFQDFSRKHIDPSCSKSCNKELGKSLFGCKAQNTFICAGVATVRNLCRGTKDNQNKLSSTEFKIINCKRRGRKGCSYTQNTTKAKICVTCRNGEPVHFHNVGRC